jgi:integrase
MFRKSGNRFFDENMLNSLIWREFFSFGCFHPNGKRARRAGIVGPGRRGSHIFRHSLATSLLRSGATLTEIGQLLRHEQQDTTRIYAKVDLDSLRPLGLPWLGDEQ